MRHPSRRGAMSRTMVSTSGSSGTLDLAPGDVTPPGLPLERNPLRRRAAGGGGRGHRGTQASHAQHASTRGAQPAFIVPIRARMKYDHIVAQLGGTRQSNGDALFRIVGVAARRENGGDRGSLDGQHLLACERIPLPLRDRDEVLTETGQKRGKKSLRLG